MAGNIVGVKQKKLLEVVILLKRIVSIRSKDVDNKGYVDCENHVHFHKNGATITKNGKNIL